MHFNRFQPDQPDTIPFSWNDETTTTESAVKIVHSQLKRPTRFGVFRWWSEQIPSWIHPDDQLVAERLIPGNRVFRRDECENASDRELGYSVFRYGREWLRGKPALWLEIGNPEFEMGDLIEIKSQNGKHRLQIAEISAILWNQKTLKTEFRVSINGIQIAKPYYKDEIRPAIRLGRFLTARERQLASRREGLGER